MVVGVTPRGTARLGVARSGCLTAASVFCSSLNPLAALLPGWAADPLLPSPPLSDMCSTWKRRHLAAWLHGTTRQHLRACLPQPAQPSAQAAGGAGSSGPTLGVPWLLNALAVLEACGGFRETADLLCDLLAALLRTVATAAAGAASGAAAAAEGNQAALAVSLQLAPALCTSPAH